MFVFQENHINDITAVTCHISLTLKNRKISVLTTVLYCGAAHFHSSRFYRVQEVIHLVSDLLEFTSDIIHLHRLQVLVVLNCFIFSPNQYLKL
jgi:hypothetical protein